MSWSRRNLVTVAAASALGLAGCRGTSGLGESTGTPPRGAAFAYTHTRASGNRVLDGRGATDRARPVDVETRGTPAWLLAFGGPASRWTVVARDGTARTHRVDDGESQLLADHGAVPVPPLAYAADGTVGFVGADDAADRTHPVAVEDGLLYAGADGDVVLRHGDGTARFDVEAPRDGRIVDAGDGRYAFYGGRTDRYRHGALGDTTEGSRLVVLDVGCRRVEADVRLEAPTVFEGLSPLVADVDGDGAPELVTTVADADDGARIRIYGIDGAELATGPVYGPGWRHQLCVAPFAPDGAPELAVVRKPHVDRTLEFYRLAGGALRVTATREGYASHTYGSRNVDGGLAADLDGDGRPELLVPTADRATLDAVARAGDRTETAWSLSLGGRLTTNLTGAALTDGRLAVGAGTADGVRVWQG